MNDRVEHMDGVTFDGWMLSSAAGVLIVENAVDIEKDYLHAAEPFLRDTVSVASADERRAFTRIALVRHEG